MVMVRNSVLGLLLLNVLANPKISLAQKCVMKGICGANAFGHIPCKADTSPEAMTDPEALDILKANCPSLVSEAALCCDKDQIIDLNNMFELVGLFLKPCPSCFANYMNTFLKLACSPEQSKFAKVMISEPNDDGQEQVRLVDFFVRQDYTDQMFESCKNVTRFGIRQLDNFCKPWPAEQCSPKRMFQYLGSDPDHGSYFPYMIDFVFASEDKYMFENEEFVTFGDKVFRCDEPAIGQDKCSCDSCPAAC